MALDLSGVDADMISGIDNGSWEKKKPTHWRVPTCVFCEGTRESAQDAMETAAMSSLGVGPGLALFIRWKGVEKAVAYDHRGCQQHSYLPEAVKSVCNAKKLKDAEEQIVREPDGDLMMAKCTVKIGKVIKHYENDPAGHGVNKILVMSVPLHHFLNRALDAEKKTSELMEKCAAQLPDENLEEAKVIPMTLNSRFLTGQDGRQAIGEFTAAVLDYSSTFWDTTTPMSREDQFTAAGGILRGAGATWGGGGLYF